MTTLFISDLHLQDERPDITQALLDFLHSEAPDADTLYILGDLFEYWIGDDALSPTAQAVGKALAALSKHTPIYFLHGNRDFLLGQTYAEAANMQLLTETTVIDLYGQPTLLLHGDTLCTDDVQYQVFRRMVRDPAWQQEFLNKTIQERIQMAKLARDGSKAHMDMATDAIMDVNDNAVQDTFKQHHIQRMIHGHTHRPATHTYRIDGQDYTRIVLGDWYTQGSVLRVTEQAAELAALDMQS